MGNQGPLVSVLMTAYNRGKYIAEAIESVLASTYENFELIIVDDCSKDDTVKIAELYALKDSRIKLFVNEKNLGQFENRNIAATYATGTYLKYVDSDDIIFPWGLEYCVMEMEKFPQASIGLLYIKNRYLNESFLMAPEETIRTHYFNGPILSIGPTGTIFKKQWFKLNSGYDLRFDLLSDNFLNIQLAVKAPAVFLPRVFFDYRVHDEQQYNEKGYIIYGYMYNKEAYFNANLPLRADELLYLKRKLEKRHFVNMVRYWMKTKRPADVFEIISITKYKWWKIPVYVFW